VAELRGWSRENGALRLGAGLTYAEAMRAPLSELLPALAEASRTVGSPQIRNRGTIGGNLGTCSPAGDGLPPLFVEGAEIEVASVRGTRLVPIADFMVGPKRNSLSPDELITAVLVSPSGARQTFMKVGPRNAMVIAVCSLALSADRERGRIRAAFGSAPCPPRPRRPRAGQVSDVRIEVTINGEPREADVWPGASLLTSLRDDFGLPGSKNACEQGECGSCSVLLDGVLVCSCLVLAPQADGHEVTTVEGLARDGELHPVQEAFVQAGAVQCGFCTPGLVVATADLLAHNPRPTEDEIREALSGNLCRCTGYVKIFEAVKAAASA
jgi:carbon-monoxide dehydrogenase small subunit